MLEQAYVGQVALGNGDTEPELILAQTRALGRQQQRRSERLSRGRAATSRRALWDAQTGHKAPYAKPLKGFSGATVLEIVDDFDGDTYRAVYTVRFARVVYVLHAFQKKSKKGIVTPRAELDLITRRLRQAKEDYERWTRSAGPEFP